MSLRSENHKHILLVEDEVITGMAEKAMLEKQGFRVTLVNSGERALAILFEESIDLVLMDISLGDGINGIEAAEKILSQKNLPIVFLTNHNEQAVVEQVKNISKYGFVLKNSGEFVILEAVNMALLLYQANETIRTQKDYLETLLDSIEKGVIATDLQSRIKRINPQGLKLCGLTAKLEDVLHKHIDDIFPVFQGREKQRFLNPALDVIRSNQNIVYSKDLMLMPQSGSAINIHLTGSPIRDLKGEVSGAILVFRDVTEELKKETSLRQYVSLLDAVIHQSPVPMILISAPDMKILFANRASLDYFGFEPDCDFTGLPLNEMQVSWKVYDSQGKELSYTEMPMVKALKGIKTQSTEFKLVNHKGCVRYSITEALPIYDTSGQLIAGFAMFVEITQRKKIEQALEESKERFRAIAGLATEAVFIHDQGVGIEMNDAVSRITGYTREEIIGRNIFQKFVHPDFLSLVTESLKSPQNGPFEIKIFHRSGAIKILEMETREIHWQGHSMRMGTARDITLKKKLERAFKITQFGMEYSQIGIFQILDSGRIEYVNQYGCRMLGYTREELLSKYIFEIDYTISRDHWPDRRKNMKKKEMLEFESFHIRKDGHIFPVEVTINYFEIDGTGISLAFINDITPRKESETALIESEERLSLAVEGAGVGLWDWHIQTGELIINERWAQTLGYSSSELEPISINTWFDLCHPEDLIESQKIIEDHFSGLIPYYEFELRMKHKSGEWKWVLDKGKVSMRDEEGKPVRMTGTQLDISKHKRMQDSITRLLEEKKMILQEVHHRIKNDMTVIHSLLSIQEKSIKNPELAEILTEAKNRIHLMGTIYNNLYRENDFREIDIASFIFKLFDSIKRSYEISTSVVEKIEIENVLIPSKQAVKIGILLNELITNAYKYAFESDQGEIQIKIKKGENNTLNIYIADNGKGLPEEIVKAKHYGFGLNLVAWITGEHDGHMDIKSSDKGTQFNIVLKLTSL